jgi:hypothetical protein
MHEELLELVQTFSDASTISDTSLVREQFKFMILMLTVIRYIQEGMS